ncbi:MAG: hypothetical protein HZC51_06210 [Nitrospirae bacterium]|nr:hypothetical protein [Nitrospirota bacterium]
MPYSRAFRLFGGLLLMLAFALAYTAPSRADEAAAKPKRVIHGNPQDRRAVEALLEESVGDAEVTVGKTISSLNGKFKLDKNKPVEDAALDFIDRHRNAFGLKNAKREFKLIRRDEHEEGDVNLRFNQSFNGVPIWGKELIVHIDKTKDLDLIISENVPTPDIDTTPLITAEEALSTVRADLKIPSDNTFWKHEKELVIYNDILAYRVNIMGGEFFVNAKNGSIIRKDFIAPS